VDAAPAKGWQKDCEDGYSLWLFSADDVWWSATAAGRSLRVGRRVVEWWLVGHEGWRDCLPDSRPGEMADGACSSDLQAEEVMDGWSHGRSTCLQVCRRKETHGDEEDDGFWVLAGMPTKTTGKENVRDGWVLK
jgi:hypothetical protein